MVEINFKYLLKQTSAIYIFAFLAAPLGYLIRILYAREFSVAEFGLIYSIIGLIGLISIFNDLGFTETLNYYATRFYEKKQYAKVKGSLIFSLLMQGGTALLMGFAFYFLSPWLAANYFKSEMAISTLRWFILYMFFYNVSRPVVEIFVAKHNYYYKQLSEFIQMFVTLLLSSALIFLPTLKNTDYIGFVWGIGYFILIPSFYILAKKKYPKTFQVKADLSFSLYKRLFNYAYVVMIGSGALFLLQRIDILMITHYESLTAVGLYSVALAVASIISVITGPAIRMMFPLTSKLDVNDKKSQIEDMIRAMYNFGLYATLPFFIILAVYPQEIINLLFGSKYLGARIALVILAFAVFIRMFQGFNFNIAAGLGMVKKRTAIMYAGGFINVIANLVLVPKYGIEGAAIATLLAIVLMMILGLNIISSKINFSINKKSLFKIIVVNLCLLFIISFLKKVLTMNLFAEAAMIGVIASAFYLTAGYLWNIVDFDNIKNLVLKNLNSS